MVKNNLKTVIKKMEKSKFDMSQIFGHMNKKGYSDSSSCYQKELYKPIDEDHNMFS